MNVVEYFEKRTHKTNEECPKCKHYLNSIDGWYDNYGDYFECPNCGFFIKAREYYKIYDNRVDYDMLHYIRKCYARQDEYNYYRDRHRLDEYYEKHKRKYYYDEEYMDTFDASLFY